MGCSTIVPGHGKSLDDFKMVTELMYIQYTGLSWAGAGGATGLVSVRYQGKLLGLGTSKRPLSVSVTVCHVWRLECKTS